MKKHLPFVLKKEKTIQILNQNALKEKIPNNSLNNFNIIKINSCINLDSKCKNKIFEPIKEETIHSSSLEPSAEFNAGRWTEEEHSKFLKGILEYGNEWKMVQKIIKTRSSTQARSHAQKFFLKIKKVIKSQKMQFNEENLLNYISNSIKNFNDGQPLTEAKRKRLLNVIILNFQNFGKDETKSCDIMDIGTKNIIPQKEGDKSAFCEKEYNKNIVSEKNSIIIENIENNYFNSNLENKKNVEENKIDFCNKKRKNSWFTNKIFKIDKVIKYKYSNNVNKKIGNSNKKVFVNLKKPNIKKINKIKKTKNKPETEIKFNHNIICPIINGNYIINNNIINITNNYNNLISNNNINSNNKKNINFNNNNDMNCLINNNSNNNIFNDFTNFDMNKFNFPEPLFDFDASIRKINFCEDDYPKYNILESQKKLFFDGIELNDSFRNNFFEENILSLGEKDDENSIINKEHDLFEYKL
jgi:SHAQKYF class myb-like DNA-binding protein